MEMFLAILEAQSKDMAYYSEWLNKSFDNLRHSKEPLHDSEMDIQTYYTLMKQVLEKKPGRRVPSTDTLMKGVHILYTIHQGGYIDVEDFFQKLNEKFGMYITKLEFWVHHRIIFIQA